MANIGRPFSIAIDGTAASGKSTVAQILAQNLGCGYLDTGKLYRAIALDFLTHLGTKPEAWAELKSEVDHRLSQVDLKIEIPTSGECRILLERRDVNEQLSELGVESATPFAARLPEVREFLLDVQRDLAKTSSVVMAGRDIGTVVLPKATLKVFIEADLEERARRRLIQHRENYTQDELKASIEALSQRDQKDANREHAPMAVAKDALLLNSTERSPDDLVAEISQVLHERLCRQETA